MTTFTMTSSESDELDEITRGISAYDSFAALVHAGLLGWHRPTFRDCTNGSDIERLADAYDGYMAAHGNDTRISRFAY